MPIVRKTLADLQSRPRGFTTEERARLLAMTEEEIERAAASDPDNPPLTEDDFARMISATRVRRARERTGMSREAFAAAFRLEPERLADIEDGVVRPDATFLAYLQVIDREPDAVRRALRESAF